MCLHEHGLAGLHILPPFDPCCVRPAQYDTDVVTWSPQGRIHQIEYAMEAVKQGSAAVGLKASISSPYMLSDAVASIRVHSTLGCYLKGASSAFADFVVLPWSQNPACFSWHTRHIIRQSDG